MIDPLQCSGGAKELDQFIESLKSNLPAYSHLFPRGNPDQVKNVVSFFNIWNSHPDTTQ